MTRQNLVSWKQTPQQLQPNQQHKCDAMHIQVRSKCSTFEEVQWQPAQHNLHHSKLIKNTMLSAVCSCNWWWVLCCSWPQGTRIHVGLREAQPTEWTIVGVLDMSTVRTNTTHYSLIVHYLHLLTIHSPLSTLHSPLRNSLLTTHPLTTYSPLTTHNSPIHMQNHSVYRYGYLLGGFWFMYISWMLFLRVVITCSYWSAVMQIVMLDMSTFT